MHIFVFEHFPCQSCIHVLEELRWRGARVGGGEFTPRVFGDVVNENVVTSELRGASAWVGSNEGRRRSA